MSLATRVLLLGSALLLIACAPQRPRTDASTAMAAQEARELTLAAQPDFSVQGRLAVSNGRDGGNGQLHWRQQGAQVEFELRAPVSRQTWRLTAGPGRAVIEGLEGGPREGREAEALLQRELGWTLPLSNLAAWARGLRGPGRARIEFDPEGLPRLIEQGGWTIEYRGWDRGSEPAMPSRVFASRGQQRVRLAIERWDSLQ